MLMPMLLWLFVLTLRDDDAVDTCSQLPSRSPSPATQTLLLPEFDTQWAEQPFLAVDGNDAVRTDLDGELLDDINVLAR